MPQTLTWVDLPRSPRTFTERSIGWGTAFPAEYWPNGWFIRTDLEGLFQNTEQDPHKVPIWAGVLGTGTHDHSDADHGGILDEILTQVNLNGVNVDLLTLMVL